MADRERVGEGLPLAHFRIAKSRSRDCLLSLLVSLPAVVFLPRVAANKSDGSGCLDRLRDRLDRANFEVLSEEEDSEILAQVREQARHHPAFREWLRSLPRTKDSPRAMVYEALAADSQAHGELLLEELDEALSLVERVPDPSGVLFPFCELAMVEAPSYRSPVCERLGRLLTSTVPEVRRWAVDVLRDLLEPSDTELVLRVRTLLERDPNWRVRHAARLTLDGLELLPANYQPSWMDRLRVWLLPNRAP